MALKHDLRYGGALMGKAEEIAVMKSFRQSIKSGNMQTAEEAKLFEKELSEYLGIKHAILTTSGSCGALLILQSLELPRGSEVIISAVTFPTVFNSILQCGLVPVVLDAKVGSYTFDLGEVEKAITKKTKAIIGISAVGNPVDWLALKKLAKKHKIKTILDNCDGLSTTINGKMVETYADISFTSFHAAHIVSMGVGGGVFTNNATLAQRVRMYRDWGRQADTSKPNTCKTLPKDQNPRFIYEKIGYNFQILELQAAMGRVQLKKVEETKAARQKNFDLLSKGLFQFGDLILPSPTENASVCWFSYPITTVGDRGELVKHLESRGIETRSMFGGNILAHPAYKHLKKGKDYRVYGKLEETNYIMHHSFWITCHPRLRKVDIDYIIGCFREYYETNNKT